MTLALAQSHVTACLWIIASLIVLTNLLKLRDAVVYEHKIGETFVAGNVFQNLQEVKCKVITIFVGQLLLTAFLVSCLIVSLNLEGCSYTYWFTAVVAVQMAAFYGRAGDSQLGYVWRGPLWGFIFKHWDEISFRTIVGDQEVHFTLSPCEIIMRAGMSFMVNGIARDMIGYLTPLLLMTSSSTMDFVKDCIAIGFVFQLDDLGSGREYRFDIDTEELSVLNVSRELK